MHVGNARTGLFSWLFARHAGGAFVLRIEDTDANRVTDDAIEVLIGSLRWLGIDWDEGPGVEGPHGPYRQTERANTYREAAEGLLVAGHAYRCYCMPEELETRRKQALAEGRPPGYDGRCKTLTQAEHATFETEGRPFALRFAMPESAFTVHDLVRGDVEFAADSTSDFVLLRSDGSPTYMLAAPLDDHLMEMTHVIRGEDLLPSTPGQMALIKALGATPPAYAHLPLIVGPDHAPLSKRHGAVSVESFRERGYLADALMNYLALLGWSKDGSTTFMSKGELVAAFDIARVARNPAAFDTEKLQWMNLHYLQQLPAEELAARMLPFFGEQVIAVDTALLVRAVPLVNERMRLLPEGVELLGFLFTDDVAPNEKARALIARAPEGYLARAAGELEALPAWTHEAVAAALRGGDFGWAQPHEGLATGPRRRDREQYLAPAAGIAGVAGSRADGCSRPRRYCPIVSRRICAESSGATVLMPIPEPSSNPAGEVSFGMILMCQRKIPSGWPLCGAEYTTRL